MSDDVTPIVQSHPCASCRQVIQTLNPYEGHDHATCMQPEIRMRRAEAQILELAEALHAALARIDQIESDVRRLEGQVRI